MAKSLVQHDDRSDAAMTGPPTLEAIRNATATGDGARVIRNEDVLQSQNKMVAGVPLMSPKPPVLDFRQMEAQLQTIKQRLADGKEPDDIEQEMWQAVGHAQLKLAVMEGGFTRLAGQQIPYPPISIDFGKPSGQPPEMYVTPDYFAQCAAETNRRILAGAPMDEAVLDAKAFVAYKIGLIKEHLRNATFYHPQYAGRLRCPAREADHAEDAAIQAGLAAMERKAKKAGKKIDVAALAANLAAIDMPRDDEHPVILPGTAIPGVAR